MSFDLGFYWNKFIDFIYSIALSIADMFKDVAIFIFESFMDICISIISGFNEVMSVFDISSYYSQLPSDVTNIMGLLDLGTCTKMIAAAILIRVLLQLIPFVRLGS